MSGQIRITRAAGTWVVRAGGAVIGESTDALELEEPGYEPVIYFPRDDIAMAFLERSERVTHSPHKGDAAHFAVVTESQRLPEAAWSYEAPLEGVARIAGHIAFYPGDEVAVERL